MLTDEKPLQAEPIRSKIYENIELNIKNNANFEKLKRTILKSFLKYDSTNLDSLTHDEFIGFINQLRMSLYLSNADDDTLTKMIQILDPENTNQITKQAFEEKLKKIIDLIAKPGKMTEKFIKDIFIDFNRERTGFLTKANLRLLFGQICDMMHVNRLEEWELDYLLTLLDEDGNHTIDPMEFIHNYLFIAQNLMKNKPLTNDRSSNLLEEIVRCSNVKNEDFFIEGLLEKFNCMRNKDIGNDKMKIPEEEFESCNISKKPNDILQIPSMIDMTIVQRNKELCQNCRKLEKRKSIANQPRDIQFSINDKNSRGSVQVRRGKSMVMENSIKEENSRKTSTASIQKIIEEQFDELLFAPYKINMSMASINNEMNKSVNHKRSKTGLPNLDHLYQIKDQNDFIPKNESKENIQLSNSGGDEVITTTSVGSLDKFAEKKIELEEKMNTQRCLEKITREENRQNIVKALMDLPLGNVAISMPYISEYESNQGRNYNLLRQMAFYKNCKNMPDEVNALFNELELDDSLSFLAEIEKLQETFTQNMENITDFMTNSIKFHTAKLEAKGVDKVKINDIISEKFHLDHPSLNQNIINYKPSTPNLQCLQTTQVVPSVKIPKLENNNTANTTRQPNLSLSNKIKSEKKQNFDRIYDTYIRKENKKDSEGSILDKGFIIKKTANPRKSMTNSKSTMNFRSSTPVLKENYSYIQAILSDNKPDVHNSIFSTSKSQIFQKNYEPRQTQPSQTLKNNYAEYKCLNYKELEDIKHKRHRTHGELKISETDVENYQQSKEQIKDKFSWKTYIQSEMNKALQHSSLNHIDIRKSKNYTVVEKGCPEYSNFSLSNEGSSNPKKTNSENLHLGGSLPILDHGATMNLRFRKGPNFGKVPIGREKWFKKG